MAARRKKPGFGRGKIVGWLEHAVADVYGEAGLPPGNPFTVPNAVLFGDAAAKRRMREHPEKALRWLLATWRGGFQGVPGQLAKVVGRRLQDRTEDAVGVRPGVRLQEGADELEDAALDAARRVGRRARISD